MNTYLADLSSTDHGRDFILLPRLDRGGVVEKTVEMV